MNFLTEFYQKTLIENQRNIHFWEDYLQSLRSLDFNTFADKLRVPVMVPVGSRILFRGEMVHTNEITVSLGADYFVKCSVKQAEVLRQHRIKDAESKLDGYRKELEHIENKVSFTNENIFKNQGQEIVEVLNDDEESLWREKHRENVKQWKQKEIVNNETLNKITDEELWNRLEELELQEELENELIKLKATEGQSFVIKEDKSLEKQANEHNKTRNMTSIVSKTETFEATSNVKFTESNPEAIEKFDLLQKVIDKQNELEVKMLELKNQNRSKSKTQEDLVEKLDKLEILEELEDEMERLKAEIDEQDVTSEEELEEESADITSKLYSGDSRRRVSFADQDDSATLELTFHHSDVEECTKPYNKNEGITKPSDIYAAFPNNFTEITSILKKKKFEDINAGVELTRLIDKKTPGVNFERDVNIEERTIVVKDVGERVLNDYISDGAEKRPMSLFKQKRQQNKK